MKTRQELFTILGLVATALVIVLAGAFLLVLPQRSEVKKLNTKAAKAQTEVMSIQASHAGGASLHASQIFALNRAMPTTPDIGGIMLALSRAARTSSIQLTSVRPAAPIVLADGSSAVPLQIAVQGSFSGVTRFLHLLRRQVGVSGQNVRAASRLFLTDSISLSALVAATSPTGASGPGGQVTANLNLVAFQYAEPVAPTQTTGASGVDGSGSSSSSSASAAGAPQGGQ